VHVLELPLGDIGEGRLPERATENLPVPERGARHLAREVRDVARVALRVGFELVRDHHPDHEPPSWLFAAKDSRFARKTQRFGAALAGSSACVDKRLFQQLEASVEILVGYDERYENSNDVSVQAAREEDQPALAGGRGRCA